ncbi:MAG: CDP-alcohol phosphatidyltransferase family protein [Sphingobacteriaceae bacterium]
MQIKKHIPNVITCGNLVCGCVAILQIFEGNMVLASYLVGLAAVLDFFDGFAARLLKVSSPIGKDLDSLADMVTFGVVPGLIMHRMLQIGYLVNHQDYEVVIRNQWMVYIPLLIPVFSAVRLAKFNNDTRQTEAFIGVPTPANAILICSIPLIVNWDTQFDLKHCGIIHFLIHPYAILGLSVLMSYLLVAELPLFSLKFKQFGWKGNEIRFVFLALSLVSLIVFQFLGLTIAIVLYIVLSLVNNLFFKPKTQSN